MFRIKEAFDTLSHIVAAVGSPIADIHLFDLGGFFTADAVGLHHVDNTLLQIAVGSGLIVDGEDGVVLFAQIDAGGNIRNPIPGYFVFLVNRPVFRRLVSHRLVSH